MISLKRAPGDKIGRVFDLQFKTTPRILHAQAIDKSFFAPLLCTETGYFPGIARLLG